MKVILIICAIIPIVLGVPVQKWYRSAIGSLYYIEAQTKFNWYEAWNECARKNMQLIAIDTYEKHLQIDDLIKKIFPVSPSFWLAGHDNAVDLRYEWATTGRIFEFTNWGPNQPDRQQNNEHCILIWQGTWQWYDLPCGYRHIGFICEEKSFAYPIIRALEYPKRVLNASSVNLLNTSTSTAIENAYKRQSFKNATNKL